MSNDNPWDNPNKRPGGPGGANRGEDGWGEPKLPGPGETWDDVEPAKPGLPDMNWGTAGPDGPPPGPPPGGSPFGPPPGPPPSGAPFGPPSYGGPGMGGPMVHQPQYNMTSSNQLDTNDIIAIAITALGFPGIGHLMLGQATKGIALLAANIFTCGGFGLLYFFTIIDLYFLALARKKRQVGDWEFLPK